VTAAEICFEYSADSYRALPIFSKISSIQGLEGVMKNVAVVEDRLEFFPSAAAACRITVRARIATKTGTSCSKAFRKCSSGFRRARDQI